jgi:DNA replication ATP-dependent helicase Dna2
LDEVYNSPLVVGTTCLGINQFYLILTELTFSFIFNNRKFDYCIVDEASQITLPACLGPLRYADRFVLVGDHYQLAPLVRNAEAQKGGLDVSLFKLLSERHPTALAILEHQYRMNEDIMLLSNSLVYDGLLKCGNEKVAKQTLHLPNPSQLNFEDPWIRDILSDRYDLS